jgi:MYXO-CTERM domain-containing protein
MLLLVPLLLAMPAPALAQPAGQGAEAEVLFAEVEQDYASALSADCTTACRALDSISRATEHLCAIDPGDRCARARQRLADASAHVHATCPACAAPREEGPAKHAEVPAQSPTPPPPPPPAAPAAEEEVRVSKRGGCAGCSTSQKDIDPPGWIAAGIALLAFVRARSRRR